MSRTCFAALALISLVACGGAKQPATTHTRFAASADRATPTRPSATKPKARRKAVARPDTSARNPLTNH